MRARGVHLAVPLALLAASSFATRAASAEDCFHTRPTDPGGANGYEYAPAEVRHFDGEKVRVFYAASGDHAPVLTSVRSDGVPDSVALVASVTDDALARYAAMGYRAPISDSTYDTCASNGGDGRFDVYLVRFGGADGVTVSEACKDVGKATRCSGYIMADSTFSRSGYGSYAEGVRTVLPHETFHAIQNAYDAELDRAWAEGSAQWATKELDPSLKDLERFLPAFFSDNSRSMDVPASGATASYLYGAAIWPVFLSQRHGPAIVRRALEVEGESGGSSVTAVGVALSTLEKDPSSLESELPLFAAWNLATGKRAGQGGYTDAASYPMAKMLTLGAEAQGLTTGYAWFGYALEASDEATRRDVSIETDPTRNVGLLVPLESGVPDLTRVKKLPATDVGPSWVVVAGVSPKKSDAPYVLRVVPHAVADAGVASDAGGVPDASDENGTVAESGCSVRRARSKSDSRVSLAACLGLVLARVRVRSKRRALTRR